MCELLCAPKQVHIADTNQLFCLASALLLLLLLLL
jgi:hypothetical protein